MHILITFQMERPKNRRYIPKSCRSEVEGWEEKDSKGTADHMAFSSTSVENSESLEQKLQDTLQRYYELTGVSVFSCINTYDQILIIRGAYGPTGWGTH